MPRNKKTPPPEIPSIQEEAGLPPNWQPVDVAPLDPNNPSSVGPPMPSGRDPFQTGALPSNFGLQTDLVRTGTPSNVPSVRLMPIAPSGLAQSNAAIKSVATTIVNEAITQIPPAVTIDLESNGVLNSSQTVLNLSNGQNTTVVAGAAGLVQTNVPVFQPSGASHSSGAVPDPGATAGTTRYLREDATFDIPPASQGVNKQTGSYLALSTDSGFLISFNITGASTLTLPATSGATWSITVENNGSALLTVDPNGLNLDYTANSIVLGPNQGIAIYSDGTNYFTNRGLGDGLIHGSTPTEIDAAAIVLQDDFASGNVTTGQIGSLGWNISNAGASAGTVYNNVGGPFPYFGEFAIGATTTANSGYVLTSNNYNGSGNGSIFSPFIATPSWKMIWVFRLMPNLSAAPSAGFDLTNRALYIGLGTPVGISTSFAQRPYNFVGLRFDGDTTAPSIGDTSFHFEVLQNGPQSGVTTRTSSNGVNNQGGATFSITSTSCTSNVITITAANTLQLNSMVTFSNLTTSTFLNGVTANVVSVTSTSFTINFTHANYSATTETGTATLGGSVTNTGLTPTIGKHYRFEMSCSVAGQVNMLLTDGTTTVTANNVVVPQYSFNIASGWVFANDYTGEFKIQCNTNTSVVGPFGVGSVLTFSNFTSTAAVYNGSQTVFNNGGTILQFLTSTSTGAISLVNGTVAGYPSHLIQASFGSTTSGSATNECALHIDFFGFSWNPGINSVGGTPNSVKPRYW